MIAEGSLGDFVTSVSRIQEGDSCRFLPLQPGGRMASDPALRQKILVRLKELCEDGEYTIYQLTLDALKDKLGLLDESNTRVDKALRSLHDKKHIRCSRPSVEHDRSPAGKLRAYKVSLLKSDVEIPSS